MFSSRVLTYLILLGLIGLLMICHNHLLTKPMRRIPIDLTVHEQWRSYGLLVGGTLILMGMMSQFTFASLSMLTAIGLLTIVGFFTVITLQALLVTMRMDRLSLKFFLNQNFLLALYLITLVELSILNGLKEVASDLLQVFSYFVVVYSLLVTGLGILLGRPKENDKRIWPLSWQEQLMVIVDPLIIVLSSVILVQGMVEIILLLGFRR